MVSIRVSVLAVLFVIVGLVAGPVADQTSGAPTPPSRPAAATDVAQADSRAVAPRFRSGVGIVALDVCVKDREGMFIAGLAAEDFLILENNAPQKVALFSPEGRVPLAVALLIDRSASMAGTPLERAKAAGVAFVRSLSAEDLVEVVAFNERADRRLALSTDRAAAEAALDDLSASGSTGLLEAVLVALRDLGRAEQRLMTTYRYAIVLLSDGEDTSSRLPFEDVLEDVRRSGVLVYGISLRLDEKGRTLPPRHELSQLVNDSGGRAIAIDNLQQLAPVYEEIAAELRHLYRLGYVPTNQARDGAWRRVSVRLPGSQDARVRTRAGYYAPRGPGRFRWAGGQS